MQPTDTRNNPEYFHKVIDCQYACPAHTPVPEYIRLIAAGRYTDAYMLNWESNVFPGILGRTCDRPCEPACRRGRLEGEEEPVAICRLKRVAADYKEMSKIKAQLPHIPSTKNGKTIALVGAGPASLTVARDLAPLGYTLHLYDEFPRGGGMMRSQIPAFRLPESVLDEEVDYILAMGVVSHFNHYVKSLHELMQVGYDAIFIGTGAPQGRDLSLPGRKEGDTRIHIGVNWLASVAFEHITKIGERVVVIGGGNTAMDCCRTARRLGGKDIKVVVRSPFEEMKASPWEKEDALAEDITILNNHNPLEFICRDGSLQAMTFDRVKAVYDEPEKRHLRSTQEAPVEIPCDDVLIAVGQDAAFPWIERHLGIEFDERTQLPIINPDTFQSTQSKIFFGGDAACGPENIITAVAHGHQAAISIDRYCQGEAVSDRLPPHVNLIHQKMGIHEWRYDSEIAPDERYVVPHEEKDTIMHNRKVEVELGFDRQMAYAEAQRCLNCDVQTIFTENRCIECDACMDICPTHCITFTENGTEEDLRGRLKARADNVTQDLYVSAPLKTQRVMVKDEDVCLHCALCAERCPTAAWDMQQYVYQVTKVQRQQFAPDLIAVDHADS